MQDNTPVDGCRGCETTGGRRGCAIHGGILTTVPLYPQNVPWSPWNPLLSGAPPAQTTGKPAAETTPTLEMVQKVLADMKVRDPRWFAETRLLAALLNLSPKALDVLAGCADHGMFDFLDEPLMPEKLSTEFEVKP